MSAPRRRGFPHGIEPGITDRLSPDLFAGLAPAIRTLHRPRPWRRIRDLVFYSGLWLLGAAVLLWPPALDGASGTALHAAGTVLAALGLNGFVLLVHEGMHGTLFRHPGLNRGLSVLFSCTHLMSFTAYQVLHIKHHRNVGSEGDPDHYANYITWKPALWVAHGLRLAAAAFAYLIAIPVLAWRDSGAAARRRMLKEYLLLAILATPVALWVPSQVLVDLWLGPMVIVALLTQLRAFAQHTLTDPTHPLLAARSMRPAAAVSYLMLHENYHLEHHLFPRVPSYSLPRLADLLEPRLPKVVVGSSYLALIGRFLWASRRMDETPVTIREQAGFEHPDLPRAPKEATP